MPSFPELLAEAESLPVEGWDFSRLGERIRSSSPPWDFAALVAERARASPDLLDMGTGGGEWLASLPYRPPRTVATEGWSPNVEVARRRLTPLGIEVVAVEPAPDNVEQRPGDTRGRLPFSTASFSFIVNRHESFVPAEVARVLDGGGTFLTQQMGGGDFHAALGLPGPVGVAWTRALAGRQLRAAGLDVVDGGEAETVKTFADVGALAWFLRAVPWEVEDVTIERRRAALAALHERGGEIEVRERLFWLEARKAVQPQRL